MSSLVAGIDLTHKYQRVVISRAPNGLDLEHYARSADFVQEGICIEVFPDRVSPKLGFSREDILLSLIGLAADAIATEIVGHVTDPRLEGQPPHADIDPGAFLAVSIEDMPLRDLRPEVLVTVSSEQLFLPGLGVFEIDEFLPTPRHLLAIRPFSWLVASREMPFISNQPATLRQVDLALALVVLPHLLGAARTLTDLVDLVLPASMRLPFLLAGRRGPATRRSAALSDGVETWLHKACYSWGIHPDRPWAPQGLGLAPALREDLELVRKKATPLLSPEAVAHLAGAFTGIDTPLREAIRLGFGSGDASREAAARKRLSSHQALRLTAALSDLDDAILACLPEPMVKAALRSRWQSLSRTAG